MIQRIRSWLGIETTEFRLAVNDLATALDQFKEAMAPLERVAETLTNIIEKGA